MKYINCFVIYAIIKDFQQIAGAVKTENYILVLIIFQGTFINGAIEDIAYVFFCKAVFKSGSVEFYVPVHF